MIPYNYFSKLNIIVTMNLLEQDLESFFYDFRKEQKKPQSTGFTGELEQLKEITQSNGILSFQQDSFQQLLNPQPTELFDLQLQRECNFGDKVEMDEEKKETVEISTPQKQLLIDLSAIQQNDISDVLKVTRRPGKVSKKNSNVIKKLGRLILDNIQEYVQNPAANKMDQDLTRQSTNEKDKRDGFILHHLKILFSDEEPYSNLLQTKNILKRFLRKSVVDSNQMSAANKAMYLKTLKICSLRMMNRFIASRLQAPEQE